MQCSLLFHPVMLASFFFSCTPYTRQLGSVAGLIIPLPPHTPLFPLSHHLPLFHPSFHPFVNRGFLQLTSMPPSPQTLIPPHPAPAPALLRQHCLVHPRRQTLHPQAISARCQEHGQAAACIQCQCKCSGMYCMRAAALIPAHLASLVRHFIRLPAHAAAFSGS